MISVHYGSAGLRPDALFWNDASGSWGWSEEVPPEQLLQKHQRGTRHLLVKEFKACIWLFTLAIPVPAKDGFVQKWLQVMSEREMQGMK